MTWKPAGARLWHPGKVTPEQHAEVGQMIVAAIAARKEQVSGEVVTGNTSRYEPK